jgi:hypothetical protein
MASFPGSPKLVKAGFVQLDPETGAVLRVLTFQYNPEMLVRRLEGTDVAAPMQAALVPGETVARGAAVAGPLPAPREVITFTLVLDATDKLQAGDPITQQSGLLPAISALELLLYPVGGAPTVWVSGNRRIVPVRITEMQIVEQAFDPALNPIRAEVAVTLQVLKDADLAGNPRERALWDAHFAALQQLAKAAYDGGTLAGLGLTGI